MHAGNVDNLTHYNELSLGHVRNVRVTMNDMCGFYIHSLFHKQGNLGGPEDV